MCKIMEDLNEKAAREADKKQMIKTAQAMITLGKLTFEEIAEFSGLKVEEVKALAKVEAV